MNGPGLLHVFFELEVILDLLKRDENCYWNGSIIPCKTPISSKITFLDENYQSYCL